MKLSFAPPRTQTWTIRGPFADVGDPLASATAFESMVSQVRGASDMMADGSNGDPALTCTGISIGIGFEAKAMKLGALVTPPGSPDPCP